MTITSKSTRRHEIKKKKSYQEISCPTDYDIKLWVLRRRKVGSLLCVWIFNESLENSEIERYCCLLRISERHQRRLEGVFYEVIKYSAGALLHLTTVYLQWQLILVHIPTSRSET
jgi:hypothetical protein